MLTPEFKIGDRVAYAAAFLRSTGQYTGWGPAAGGRVKQLRPVGERVLVIVEWEGAGAMSVAPENLAHVGPNSRFAGT